MSAATPTGWKTGSGASGPRRSSAPLRRSSPTHSGTRSGSPPRRPDEKPTAQAVPGGCDQRPDLEDDGSAVSLLTDFVSMLAPPPRGAAGPAERRGEAVFQEVGCASCHTPTLRTGASPVAALADRDVPLYSDLLLHDLGEYLADGIHQGEAAGGSEWRTTPLWGLGRRLWYLHDARATDLRTAVELHNGEARASRNRSFKRPRNDLQDLVAFLRSLNRVQASGSTFQVAGVRLACNLPPRAVCRSQTPRRSSGGVDAHFQGGQEATPCAHRPHLSRRWTAGIKPSSTSSDAPAERAAIHEVDRQERMIARDEAAHEPSVQFWQTRGGNVGAILALLAGLFTLGMRVWRVAPHHTDRSARPGHSA